MRALLEGRKIAWIKNAEQWTTGINQTSEAVDGFAMAKDCENGWDYMKYLKFLVSMKKNSAVNYRSMDIIEVNTSAISGKSIKMDHMTVSYTHLDVYKRQRECREDLKKSLWSI